MSLQAPSGDTLAMLDAAEKAFKEASAQSASTHAGQYWTPDLIRFLSISVLAFTFGALLLGTLLLWRSRAQGGQILRVFGVISIIGVSGLLLVVGYSNDQLAPIVGLFGSIAGYLLGKESTSTGTI